MEETMSKDFVKVEKKFEKIKEKIENINDRIDIAYQLDILTKKIISDHERRIIDLESKVS